MRPAIFVSTEIDLRPCLSQEFLWVAALTSRAPGGFPLYCGRTLFAPQADTARPVAKMFTAVLL